MIHSSITLKHLETLIRVAELRSFKGAANLLGTTQPNVSVRIQTLESVLGTALLIRDGTDVRLTERGIAVRDAARRVLDEAERLVEVAQRPDLVTGRLRLGVAELVACTWLHHFLRRVSVAYPDLVVELTVDLSRNLDAGLSLGALDLVFQNRPFIAQAGGLVELGDTPYVWVAASERDLPGSMAALSGVTVLTQPRDTEAFAQLVARMRDAGVDSSRVAPSSSVASCARMARDGLGVAVLPRALVAEDIAAGALYAFDPGWRPEPLSFAARYRADGAARHVVACAELAAEIAAGG